MMYVNLYYASAGHFMHSVKVTFVVLVFLIKMCYKNIVSSFKPVFTSDRLFRCLVQATK